MISYWRAYVDLIEQPNGWWLALVPVFIAACIWFLMAQGLWRGIAAFLHHWAPIQETVSEPLDPVSLAMVRRSLPARPWSDKAAKGVRAEQRRHVVEFGPTWRAR